MSFLFYQLYILYGTFAINIFFIYWLLDEHSILFQPSIQLSLFKTLLSETTHVGSLTHVNYFYYWQSKINKMNILSTVIVLITIILLMLSGDVEMNPGPSVMNDSSLDYLFEDIRCQDLLTFSCINIQSVLQKVDILEAELGDRDVILVTETWLKKCF